VSLLVEEGVSIYRVDSRSAGLEEVFLELISGSGTKEG
jgi:hypothetical protein